MAKRKNNPKSKTTTRKPDSVKDKADENIKKSNLTNDVSWYARSEQSLKDAASLAFSDVLGMELPLNSISTEGTGAFNPQIYYADIALRMPGIMAYKWTPVIGDVHNPDEPVNVAAFNIYSYVRHANSGSANYDATDLMTYILAAGSAMSWISNLIRLYGFISNFNQKNRYMPKSLVAAMGFNYDDMIMHINDLLAFINHKISELSVLWVPNEMPLIARWFWMNANVFADGEAEKAQLYLFTPDRLMEFKNKTSTTGSSIDYVWVSEQAAAGGLLTFDEMVTLTNRLIAPLISDEDIGIMAGDILKAYGSDKIYGINQIPTDYVVMPVYDEEVLMQMHNTVVCDILVPSKITQNMAGESPYLEQTLLMNVGAMNTPGFAARRILDLKGNANDPAIVMVASRLHPGFTLVRGADNAASKVRVSTCGTEIVTGAYIYHNPTNVTNVIAAPSLIDTETNVNAAVRAKFRWCHLCYLWVVLGSGNTAVYRNQGIYGEIENFTTIGNPELVKMHRTAVYSEYGVPAI